MGTKSTIIDNLLEVIIGAEGDEENSNDESGNDEQDQEETPKGSSSDSSDNSEHDDADDPKVKGLKKALETERRERKRLERDAKTRQDADEEAELKTKTEVEQANIREQKATEKAAKLAQGMLRTSLNAAIAKAASNFIDPNDAIDGVDRSAFSFTQDEDDPSEITIDVKTVEKAVKDLATKKPHYLKTGTDDGEPSGSNFRRQKKATGDEAYKEHYPSLN